MTQFDDPKAALDHAHNHLHGPSGERLPYYMLRIHDTSNGYWLTYAQFNYWIETGQYFGPFVQKADGSIV